MDKYVIMADIACDLPLSYMEENHVEYITANFTLDGKPFVDDGGISVNYKDIYSCFRNKVSAKTSMTNVETYETHFKHILDNGDDLLFIGFSSGLSGSFNSARLAYEALAPLYPDRKFYIVDSLSASLGYGLLVDKAVSLRNEGKSIEENAAWLTENRLNIQHLFTVEDLFFLHEGGRISKSVAVIGSIVGVRPMMDMDPLGKLRSSHKKRGRKGSMKDLVDWMERLTNTKSFDTVALSHGDCEDDADAVIDDVKSRFSVGKIIKNYVGPFIGAHSGPGTLALFFFGAKRVAE